MAVEASEIVLEIPDRQLSPAVGVTCCRPIETGSRKREVLRAALRLSSAKSDDSCTCHHGHNVTRLSKREWDAIEFISDVPDKVVRRDQTTWGWSKSRFPLP
jgi:hypothetical protein